MNYIEILFLEINFNILMFHILLFEKKMIKFTMKEEVNP